MEDFTPTSALTGGALIGLSAALLWIGNGRVAGISGIVGELLTPMTGQMAWRIAFPGGLLGAALLYRVALGPLQPTAGATSLLTVLGAGLLVGFGTRLGSGCTSGHGVCGLARLSPRSLAATGVFLASGMVTAFVHGHLVGG